jgi:hypothetical protein
VWQRPVFRPFLKARRNDGAASSSNLTEATSNVCFGSTWLSGRDPRDEGAGRFAFNLEARLNA